jgi:hypothetical protein
MLLAVPSFSNALSQLYASLKCSQRLRGVASSQRDENSSSQGHDELASRQRDGSVTSGKDGAVTSPQSDVFCSLLFRLCRLADLKLSGHQDGVEGALGKLRGALGSKVCSYLHTE